MREFSNKEIKKSFQRVKNVLYVGLVLLVLGAVLFGYSLFRGNETEPTSMHELILDENADGLYGYIDIVSEPYYFAYYDDGSTKAYFASDENYLYIVEMSDETFEKIVNAGFPYRVEGSTVKMDPTLQEIAVESYNEIVDEEYQLALEDAEAMFGGMYLNIEVSPLTTEDVFLLIGLLIFIIGLIVSIVGVVLIVRYTKNVKKISLEEKEKIEHEVEDEKNAFYYQKAHVFLTKNYVLNLASAFDAILYKDIIWMYPFEYRYNGFKTSSSICLVTKDGKKHKIAGMDVVTKKSKEVYQEIYQTILEKNENILNGFTKENQQEVKKRLQDKVS